MARKGERLISRGTLKVNAMKMPFSKALAGIGLRRGGKNMQKKQNHKNSQGKGIMEIVDFVGLVCDEGF